MENEISKIHVVHFVNEVPRVGVALDKWPGHVTLVPPFELVKGLVLADVISTVQSASEVVKDSIILEPDAHEFFGSTKDIEVVRIKENEKLRKLHFDLVYVLENLGIVFTDKTWMLEGYNPHSTIVDGVELTEPTICDSLSINMKLMGQRVVARTVMLSGSNIPRGAMLK